MALKGLFGRERRASTLPLAELEFCSVDVETTGFSKKDRIVEIAMIRATAHGEVLEQFETLVNPGRSATTTVEFHGIGDGDLRDAPAFGDVAGRVADMLDQAILVAHNASFDHRFLEQEFERLGASVAGLPRVCTLQLGTTWGRPISGRLADCCEHFGVERGEDHQAASDAAAALKLLWRVVEAGRCSCLAELGVGHGEAWVMPLPATPTHLSRSGRPVPRTEVLARVVPQPAARNGGADERGVAAYRELLADALADRHLDDAEIADLTSLAASVALSPAQAADAATDYYASLADSAFADHYLSDAERRDLARVAELLVIDQGAAAELLAMASLRARTAAGPMRRTQADAAASEGDLGVQPHPWVGKSVCFSGAPISRHEGLPMTKEEAMALARARGLVTVTSVTKKTELLVVPDPDLATGKVQKARRYEIPVLPEEVFWREVGVRLDLTCVGPSAG